MKTTKRLLAVALAILLIAALSTAAFAADITISNAVADHTYYAYKIFDAAQDATTGDWSYTIDSTSPWFSTVYDTATNTSKIPGLAITQQGTSTTYSVVRPTGSTFSAADFADTLIAASVATTANAQGSAPYNATGTTIDLTAATAGTGYYLVLSYDTTGSTFEALAELTTAQSISIQDKNDVVFTKTADKQDVEVGDTVNFTLTGAVPNNIADFNSANNTDKTYTYYVSDTMTSGLTFDPTSVVVTVGGTGVPLSNAIAGQQMKDADLLRVGENGFTFELCLDLLKDDGTPRFNGNSEIKITYSATVNDNAVSQISENEATLTYSNDPTDTTSFGQQTPEVQLYSSRILIDKYETGQESHKLAGAKFVLYKEDTSSTPSVKKYYKYNAATATTPASVTWVEGVTDPATATNIDTFTTDANGSVTINGLADGDYYLLEVEAPSGYTKLADAVPLTIDGSSALSVGYTDSQITTALTNTATVANTPGSLLPSTGGIGTTIFYIVGGLLVIGAGVVLITRRRVSREK